MKNQTVMHESPCLRCPSGLVIEAYTNCAAITNSSSMYVGGNIWRDEYELQAGIYATRIILWYLTSILRNITDMKQAKQRQQKINWCQDSHEWWCVWFSYLFCLQVSCWFRIECFLSARHMSVMSSNIFLYDSKNWRPNQNMVISSSKGIYYYILITK